MLTGIPPHAERDRRYNVKEATKLLGIHRNTLRKYINDGLISAIVIPSGNIFIMGKEINRFWNQTL